jgi:hypothetical protein
MISPDSNTMISPGTKNFEAMTAAAKLLMGSHDFRNFTTDRGPCLRTLDGLTVEREGDFILFRFSSGSLTPRRAAKNRSSAFTTLEARPRLLRRDAIVAVETRVARLTLDGLSTLTCDAPVEPTSGIATQLNAKGQSCAR